MSSPDQERWQRVKEKLRAEVGEDIFQSWFARMELERVDANTAHLSVPTRFLKSWIQSHYTDRVLACWQGENPDIQKIEVTVRSAVIRTAKARSSGTRARYSSSTTSPDRRGAATASRISGSRMP